MQTTNRQFKAIRYVSEILELDATNRTVNTDLQAKIKQSDFVGHVLWLSGHISVSTSSRSDADQIILIETEPINRNI